MLMRVIFVRGELGGNFVEYLDVWGVRAPKRMRVGGSSWVIHSALRVGSLKNLTQQTRATVVGGRILVTRAVTSLRVSWLARARCGMIMVLAEAQVAKGPTVTTSRACLLSSFSCSCSSFFIAFILCSYRLCGRRRLVSPHSIRQMGWIPWHRV